jgi:polyhydroxybutyrate depolymerase
VRSVLLVTVVVGLLACGGAPAAAPASTTTAAPMCGEPGRRVERIDRRRVLLDVPPDASAPLPVVIELHGAGGSPERMADLTGFPELGARDGVLVVTPEGSGRPKGWVTFTGEPRGLVDTETQLLVDVLDTLAGCIDGARVAVVGLSNGAAMALLFPCEAPGRVRAVAAVAGILWPGARCDGTPPARVLVRQGTEDRVFESFQRFTPHGCCGGVLVWPPEEIEAAWRSHVGDDLRWVAVPGAGHEWVEGTSEDVWAFVTST